MGIKRIGILTSGGDCPGLNAIIRSVVKASALKGWEVYGIPYGTDGFVEVAHGKYQAEDLLLTKHGYALPGMLKGLDVLQFLSGSVLGSLSKGHPEQPDIAAAILKGYAMLDIEALIVVGGDGSLDIIYDLATKGNWHIIAIPKTIDNDVPFTDLAVGFSTAVDIVTQALYDLTFTAASHERIIIVQVMGRDAGHLTLHAGIAGGADIILIPEITPCLTPEVIRGCCDQLVNLRQSGRHFALIVISEGVHDQNEQKDKYIADYLAEKISQTSQHLCEIKDPSFCDLIDLDIRATTLGHLQRSGTPLSFDRLLATVFGIKAVELIEQGIYDQVVIWRNGQVEHTDLQPIIGIIKKCHQENRCAFPVDKDGFMVKTAKSLGIYLGEV
ncbi:6-phosphofructokinase [Synechocystis sp. FACHB-383]|uniref:ATP-dependent 6-phosphofructokinase n=1 Tax=unclassified Synechocystis TaxID=2640012 RepID=UPI0016840E3B|nr:MULTISPECIES: ATP-dependent 6-phosphofructokinase [unclassified Synechocystis]MBD2653861.1 6-phosphofructokinase [Synechocystis sp. FACHB-383]MBE9195631.1 6-phosphofructokinase [Synechocystis sp. LEGE 06083]